VVYSDNELQSTRLQKKEREKQEVKPKNKRVTKRRFDRFSSFRLRKGGKGREIIQRKLGVLPQLVKRLR